MPLQSAFIWLIFVCGSSGFALREHHSKGKLLSKNTQPSCSSFSMTSSSDQELNNGPSNDISFLRESDHLIDLQSQHFHRSPAETLANLSQACLEMNIDKFDVYGDLSEESEVNSYLRKFESEMALQFGKEDAVFMPSGVMAQGISLIMHSHDNEAAHGHSFENEVGVKSNNHRGRFLCHHTSHLLLWEDESYSKLIGMEAVEIDTRTSSDFRVQPMRLKDVKNTIAQERNKYGIGQSDDDVLSKTGLSTLILELPHRELGGKLTPFDDIIGISKVCKKEGIKFHCDGARIFEAAAGYGMSLKDVAQPFDSVYCSFYKGLGGITGAMLMGSKEFCKEARVWLNRFGGNLYTLLPYAVSGIVGYNRHIRLLEDKNDHRKIYSFDEKLIRLKQITEKIQMDTEFSTIASFDPEIPQTNMVHVYLKVSHDECTRIRDHIKEKLGIVIFTRIRELPTTCVAYETGFRTYFEWTLGEANASIDDAVFVEAWNEFCSLVNN